MTLIKFCGLKRIEDIQAANKLKPDFIGFVFVAGKKRYLDPKEAAQLKKQLDSSIKAVGVFIDERPETIAQLLAEGVIDLAQLHGNEDETYIKRLKELTAKPIIKAFKIHKAEDLLPISSCSADYVLLDSGTGTGKVFDWQLIKSLSRPYFLAGGLSIDNIEKALSELEPFAVDVSSGIETDGSKDKEKMAAFAALVRDKERKSNHD